MSSTRRTSCRNAGRVGLAAVAVLAFSAIGASGASANTSWIGQFGNASELPSGTQSVQFTHRGSGESGCGNVVSGASFNNFTPANPKIVAGQTYNVLAFAGKDCTGATLSASAFQPAADADVAARGLNCRQIVFIPGSGTVRWLNCS